MTVAVFSLESGLAVAIWPDNALSDEAENFRAQVASASEFRSSVALGQQKQAAADVLLETYLSARSDNWDGLGSAAVEPSTYLYAKQFLALLSSTTPMPEIFVDRDGEICLEWDYTPRRVFSVAVGRDGTLNYAGLFGHSKAHGVEQLYEGLPAAISSNLERVTATATTRSNS